MAAQLVLDTGGPTVEVGFEVEELVPPNVEVLRPPPDIIMELGVTTSWSGAVKDLPTIIGVRVSASEPPGLAVNVGGLAQLGLGKPSVIIPPELTTPLVAGREKFAGRVMRNVLLPLMVIGVMAGMMRGAPCPGVNMTAALVPDDDVDDVDEVEQLKV
jgi:hypothetical protein